MSLPFRNNNMRLQAQASKGIALEASTNLELDDLLARISGVKGTVQIFDPGAVASGEHLKWAYMNALAAFRNRANRSKSLAVEMLLFASASRQISDAVRISGAKDKSHFVVFADSPATLRRISGWLKESGPLRLRKGQAAAVMRRLGAHGTDFPDLVQAMALSGL